MVVNVVRIFEIETLLFQQGEQIIKLIFSALVLQGDGVVLRAPFFLNEAEKEFEVLDVRILVSALNFSRLQGLSRKLVALLPEVALGLHGARYLAVFYEGEVRVMSQRYS